MRRVQFFFGIQNKPANIPILGNITLFRFLKKIEQATINENTDIIENHYTDTKVPCLTLSIFLIAFHYSHFLSTKGHMLEKKNIS